MTGITSIRSYHQQMEIDRIDQEHLKLKHQELKIKEEIRNNERQRIKRLITPDPTKTVGNTVDTLA